VSPTCFGLYKAIIKETVYKEIQIQQILLIECMCRVKIQYYQLKMLKMFKI
jgi:hypothetical protein